MRSSFYFVTMIIPLLLASVITLNGAVQTENGRGVKGIPVSNGDTIVITDKKGATRCRL